MNRDRLGLDTFDWLRRRRAAVLHKAAEVAALLGDVPPPDAWPDDADCGDWGILPAPAGDAVTPAAVAFRLAVDPPPDPGGVLARAAEAFGVAPSDLRGPRRRGPRAQARTAALWTVVRVFNWPTCAAARWIDAPPSSVLAAVRAVDRQLATSEGRPSTGG